ncbi:hypothetical protein J8F10_10110 [Gemmata sp. G18]|uniref:Uncharacterized protein n=1 Tax=Gemmata palustris TaxID=2822762 RepID=A0ABS5BPH4_9BACT|nr:hypothetical protein [Gemmata palustris]MBP3955634.1 hypothetical protein [Gemmata palustris]
MSHDRRSVLTAIGLALPFGIDTRLSAAAPVGPAPVLRLRSFEEAVRAAFGALVLPAGTVRFADEPYHRIEIGHSEEVLAGLQGCHNDRPFAGYPAGHLRIVRSGSGPGPIVGGVRLYVATVDVALTGGRTDWLQDRPLDFATLPPAPVLVGVTTDERPTARKRSTGKGPLG